MSCGLGKSRRNRDLATIHIAKKDLGMDDDTYRDMLFTIARVRSAAELDEQGRKDVLAHLRACGFKARQGRLAGKPHNINSNDRGPLLKKIEAYLTDNQRPWSYAQAMAKRMFHVDQLEFCNVEQLRKIVAALEYDARRHANDK